MKAQALPALGPSPWNEAKISGSPGEMVARVSGIPHTAEVY
jgi:hypothetical protein